MTNDRFAQLRQDLALLPDSQANVSALLSNWQEEDAETAHTYAIEHLQHQLVQELSRQPPQLPLLDALSQLLQTLSPTKNPKEVLAVYKEHNLSPGQEIVYELIAKQNDPNLSTLRKRLQQLKDTDDTEVLDAAKNLIIERLGREKQYCEIDDKNWYEYRLVLSTESAQTSCYWRIGFFDERDGACCIYHSPRRPNPHCAATEANMKYIKAVDYPRI